MWLINEAYLDALNHQDVQVRKRRRNSDPAIVRFHDPRVGNTASTSIVCFSIFNFRIITVDHQDGAYRLRDLVNQNRHNTCEEKRGKHDQDQNTQIIRNAFNHKLHQVKHVYKNHGPQLYIRDHAVVKPQLSL